MASAFWIQVIAILLQSPIDSNSQASWQSFSNSTFSFDCPLMSKIEKSKFGESDSILIFKAGDRPDSISRYSISTGTKLILGNFRLTKYDFEQAALDYGLGMRKEIGWSMYANPMGGPALKLRLIRKDRLTILKGFQSVGFESSEGGWVEIDKVPYQFIHLKGDHGSNLVFEVRYEPIASKILDRIIRSIHLNK